MFQIYHNRPNKMIFSPGYHNRNRLCTLQTGDFSECITRVKAKERNQIMEEHRKKRVAEGTWPPKKTELVE